MRGNAAKVSRARSSGRPELRVIRGRGVKAVPPTWREHPEYGMCRTLTGHAWEPPKAMQVVKDEVRVRLTCQHCGTGRMDAISYRSGMVTGRAYTYPEGYQQKFEGERPAKSQLRRTYLHLMLDR
jgi:hypothetical protein